MSILNPIYQFIQWFGWNADWIFFLISLSFSLIIRRCQFLYLSQTIHLEDFYSVENQPPNFKRFMLFLATRWLPLKHFHNFVCMFQIFFEKVSSLLIVKLLLLPRKDKFKCFWGFFWNLWGSHTSDSHCFNFSLVLMLFILSVVFLQESF